jgi:hypothetical protein
MANDHGAMTVDSGMDMPAHEETYSTFIGLVEIVGAIVLSIVLLLVMWGLEGHGILALIGFILTAGAGAIGGLTGLGYKAVLPVFVLLALGCIVL